MLAQIGRGCYDAAYDAGQFLLFLILLQEYIHIYVYTLLYFLVCRGTSFLLLNTGHNLKYEISNFFFFPDSIDFRMQRLFTGASSVILADITLNSLDHLDSLEVCCSWVYLSN